MDTIPTSGLKGMDSILVSKRTAAQLLGLSIRSIELLIASKQLVSRKVGRRRLIPRAELERFARRDTPVIGSFAQNPSRS
jgi:excisionase family DNA binding protein